MQNKKEWLTKALEKIDSMSKEELELFDQTFGLPPKTELDDLLDKRNKLQEWLKSTIANYTADIVEITDQIESICEHKFTETFLYNDDDGWSRGSITYTYEKRCSVCGKTEIYERKSRY